MVQPPVEWHDDALDDLVEHDVWRVSQNWVPIAGEIMQAVHAAFARGFVFPKEQCVVKGEPLPVYKTHVDVRSKRFRVYFLDGWPPKIRRILHPNLDPGRAEESEGSQ